MRSARRLRPWLRRLLAGLLCSAVAGCALVLWQPLWAFGFLGRLFPDVVWRVSTAEPLVALTFDDGPSPENTPAVLEILARHGARATFFLIGERARAHPELVLAIRGAGHEVANHASRDRPTWRATNEDFLADLRQAADAIDLSGHKLYRPPGGLARPSQLRLAAAEGYTTVLGSAYPYDPSHPPVAYIRWLVGKNLAPGVIVILHDGIADPSRTLAALEGILRAGERRKLRFVTVGELLEAGRAPSLTPAVQSTARSQP